MTERYAVGVDFGGTKVLSGVVNLETGEVVARPRSAPRRATDPTN